jgi:hypothetical protein
MKDTIFITWEKHQRTRNIANTFGIPLYEIIGPKGRFRRYAICCWKTWRIISTQKPKKLIVQNPSIILALYSLMLRIFYRYKLIVDAHNEAITPYIHNNWLVRFLSKLIIRHSDRTIVTNSRVAEKVASLNGRHLVLPDILPKVDPIPPRPLGSPPYNVTFICTYAGDEPYSEVFESAKSLEGKANIYVTGKIPNHIDTEALAKNLYLTGFIPDDEYWKLLKNSHIIIDLTTMDDCLVCGAYEAIALLKPLILSSNLASISLFGKFAVHIDNNAQAIANAIHGILDNYSFSVDSCQKAGNDFFIEQNQRILRFRESLDEI